MSKYFKLSRGIMVAVSQASQTQVATGSEQNIAENESYRIARTLDVYVTKLQGEEVGEEVVSRVVNGKKVVNKTEINVPFSATVGFVSDKDSSEIGLKSFGLQKVISGADVTFSKSGIFEVSGTYLVPYEAPIYDSQLVSSWKEGDEIAPYCYADSDGSNYRDVLVGHETKYSEHIERAQIRVSDANAMATIIASLSASREASAKAVLSYLESSFPKEIAAGRAIVLAEHEAEVSAEMAELRLQMARLEAASSNKPA